MSSETVALKVCCICSTEEAYLAIRNGADAIGLVSEMPSGPGVIPESDIRAITDSVRGSVNTFLLTSGTDAGTIIEQCRRCRTDTIQLVDRQDTTTYREIRKHLPDLTLVQVIHVTGWEALEEAERIASQTDYLLLDSGNPDAELKQLGGTGQTHNWEISRAIVQKVSVPVFLAGGLHPGNISKAVRRVQPYGVDVCSRLRTDGSLDETKLQSFVRNLQAATV